MWPEDQSPRVSWVPPPCPLRDTIYLLYEGGSGDVPCEVPLPFTSCALSRQGKPGDERPVSTESPALDPVLAVDTAVHKGKKPPGGSVPTKSHRCLSASQQQ